MAVTPSASGPVLPLMAKRLRQLARQVENIGVGGNPEKILARKSEVVAELEELAGMVSGRGI
jgi:hypothetical protein